MPRRLLTSGPLLSPPTSPPALDTARSTLLEAAPGAADLLRQALTEDTSREQLDAAKDILDRVGIRKDVLPVVSPSTPVSDIAYGAFRALLEAFGVSVSLPETPPRNVTPDPPAPEAVKNPGSSSRNQRAGGFSSECPVKGTRKSSPRKKKEDFHVDFS